MKITGHGKDTLICPVKFYYKEAIKTKIKRVFFVHPLIK